MGSGEATLIESRLAGCRQADEDYALGHSSMFNDHCSMINVGAPGSLVAARHGGMRWCIEHSTLTIDYIRNLPRRARIVAFKSVSEVAVVRSTSASATASRSARMSCARLIAAPLWAR